MDPVITKILSSASLLASAVVGCSIPSMMSRFITHANNGERSQRGEAIMCLCNCLAAGVIMGMSFLHIFPESVHQCSDINLNISIKGNTLNAAFVLMLAAFLLMLFIERVVSFGRTPCSSVFNDCKDSSKCCVSRDEESLVNKELKSNETEPAIHQSNDGVMTTGGSRYRHRHSRILSKIKNAICPICECNGLCITLALFMHSVFEGLVVGLEKNNVHTWLITLGIVLHKWAAGMALASFLRGNAKSTILVMSAIFCLGSPLGVLIGSLILDSNLVLISVLNSIAVGTLIYVGLEIIVHELFCEIKCRKTALYKWLSLMSGITLIFICIIIEFYMTHHHH